MSANRQGGVPVLPFDVPDVPEGAGWKSPTVRQYTGGQPPKFRELKRSDRPNKQPRQVWFEETVLRSIGILSSAVVFQNPKWKNLAT